MQQRSRLTKKYQATIPQAVREALDLRPGDSVIFEVSEDKVTLSKSCAIDWEYLQSVSDTLSEWSSAADEEAYSEL